MSVLAMACAWRLVRVSVTLGLPEPSVTSQSTVTPKNTHFTHFLLEIEVLKPNDNAVLLVVDAFDTLVDSATAFTASASAADAVMTNSASMFPAMAKALASSGSDVTVLYTGSLDFDEYKFDKLREEYAKIKVNFIS